ncbi:MAG TPA: hypothetical protein DCQ56_03345 [Porphyromonadaceae bacterium]|nr:hypothetical protein [Porphyromonadaceae bacterium]
MKAKFIISSVLLGTALVTLAAKDPVLMKINGKDVKLSEFEYLYHKNNQQQVEKETLDQYVERFKIYKLKVADAEAAGIDTTAAFKSELDGYKADLVKPFLEDTTVRERLVREAYDHMLTNVNIDHFMYSMGRDELDNKKYIAFVDSIRNCVLNGEDWEELALKYSIDPSVKRNKGHYGYIGAGLFPYEFEKVVYETPVGEISKPFRTDYGIHMIRVNGTRPDDGQVHVEHILRLFPRNANDSAKAVVKVKIDSIYDAIKAGANFEEMAKNFSEDPGSARRGGDLGFFGRNRMVPQFEKVSFDLADGQISEPFETNYGYHIVKKIESKQVGTLDEMRPTIENRINSDSRSQEPRKARLEWVKKFYNYQQNPKLYSYLSSEMSKHGQYDSAFVADVVAKSNVPLYTYAKNQSKPLSELAKKLNPKAKLNNDAAVGYIISKIDPVADDDIMKYYVDNLINDNADYRNLINEYRDGIMMFEISNRRVWEGAGRDTAGLEQYYAAHKDKYTWTSPHFKGIILSATTDSIMKEVKKMIPTLGADTLTNTLHRTFGSKIKMERMTVAKGENPLADYLMFNGPKPKNKKYHEYMVLEGGLQAQPQEVADVRGQVTSDYQDVLEQKWIEELKAKYPVTVNKKVLKQVKN